MTPQHTRGYAFFPKMKHFQRAMSQFLEKEVAIANLHMKVIEAGRKTVSPVSTYASGPKEKIGSNALPQNVFSIRRTALIAYSHPAEHPSSTGVYPGLT